MPKKEKDFPLKVTSTVDWLTHRIVRKDIDGVKHYFSACGKEFPGETLFRAEHLTCPECRAEFDQDASITPGELKAAINAWAICVPGLDADAAIAGIMEHLRNLTHAQGAPLKGDGTP